MTEAKKTGELATLTTPGAGHANGVGFRYEDERWFVVAPDGDGAPGALYAMRPENKYELVCNSVPVIKRRIVDPERGDTRFEVQFSDGNWLKSLTLMNSDFQSPAQLAKVCATAGLRATEGRYLIRWFLEYEQKNRIPTEIAAAHCGWMKTEDGLRFALPGVASNNSLFVDVKPHHESSLDFSAPYHVGQGNMAEWSRLVALSGAFESPYGGIMLGTLVGSILTARLQDAPNYLQEVVGESKRGKTAVSQAAQSFLGKPGKSGMERSWADTKFGSKGSWGFLSCLPLVYEESTNAESDDSHTNKITPRFLAYELPNALKRAAGVKGGGTQLSDSWRLNAVITGESPILTRQQNAGAMNRVMTVGYTGELGPRGAAFNASETQVSEDAPFAERVAFIYKSPALKRCYGHGLVPTIEYISAMSESEIAALLQTHANVCKERLGDHGEAAHFATLAGACMAGLDIAAQIALSEGATAFWSVDSARSTLCDALVARDEDVGGTHGYRRAWLAFREWALARRVTHFYTRGTWKGGKAQACYGFWESVVVSSSSTFEDDFGGVCLKTVESEQLGDLYPSRECLSAFIADIDAPVDVDAMLRWWASQGYLEQTRATAKAFSQKHTISRARPGVSLTVYRIAAKWFAEFGDGRD